MLVGTNSLSDYRCQFDIVALSFSSETVNSQNIDKRLIISQYSF